jgi:hypothetical protein
VSLLKDRRTKQEKSKEIIVFFWYCFLNKIQKVGNRQGQLKIIKEGINKIRKIYIYERRVGINKRKTIE